MLAILLIKTFTVSVLLSAVKCSTPGLCHLHSVLLSEVSLHAQTGIRGGKGKREGFRMPQGRKGKRKVTVRLKAEQICSSPATLQPSSVKPPMVAPMLLRA